jgi:hypothetical protein
MHHLHNHAPNIDLITLTDLNPSKIMVISHQISHATFSNEPLYQEFSSNHGEHNVIGQRVKRFVHDQYIYRMNPSIDNGSALYPDNEGCGGVLLVPMDLIISLWFHL